VPGTVNVLADIMSRAVNDNISCALPREHPISKQWAKELPPLTDNFYVTRDALFEFLTRQLNPEAQDLGDRSHKKLMEPKTVQELYDLSKTVSPEEKYYSAIRLLDQWNDKYIEQKDKKHDVTDYDKWKQARVNAAKIQLDLAKQEACFKKLDEIMDKLYANIKSTPLYRRILENLKEAAKKYLYVEKGSNSEENIREFNIQIEKLHRDIIELDGKTLVDSVEEEVKSNFIRIFNMNIKEEYENEEKVKNADSSNSTHSLGHKPNRADTMGCQDYRDFGKCNHTPCIIYSLKKGSKYPPLRDCVTNSICLRTQEDITLQPNEYKKIELGIKIFSKNYNPVQLTPKLSTSLTYSLNIMTGLVNMHYRHYLQIGVHNLSTETVWIPAGVAICEIHQLKYPKRTVDEYKADFIDHGGELSPFNLYMDRLMSYAKGDRVLYEKIKQKLDKYPVEAPHSEIVNCNA
jgi:dUTPase